jgi:hypothetical protein
MVMDHAVVPAVVLVVEDEMLLRMRAVDMVEDAGFTSVEAVDADEAVAILESRSDIALLSPISRCRVAWTVSSSRTQCVSAGRPSRSSLRRGS